MVKMMMKVAFAMTCMLVAVTTADKADRPWPPECLEVANVMVEECKLFFVEQESPPTAECCGWFSSRHKKAEDRRRICRCMKFLTTAFEAIKPGVLALSDQCHFGDGFPMSKNHACACKFYSFE
ncbi:Bifunctional inhibitor/lipid-transfer protein/seed storage 2S albumin superfamily protein [Raphanus sativus]|nr:Bifunctional inhibitor/lipid-transfer protein/seed storage 2S albumin superfamily protein [Raphanus sativus]